MKFSCQQCSAAYTVPDEKVRGKRVRIKCKKCGAPIVVEGPAEAGAAPPAAAAPAAAAKPMRSFQRTQVGGLVAPPDLNEKIAAAKAAAAAPTPAKAAPAPAVADPAAPASPPAEEASAAGIRTPMAPAPDASTFGEEEEVAPRGPGAPRPKAKTPPPLPIPKAPRVAQVDDAAPLLAAVPQDHGFDDASEATKVIDPARTQELLSAQGDSTPQAPALAESAGGATAGAGADKPFPVRPMDEDEITQVASEKEARELLESVTGHAVPPEPTKKPAQSSEPLVVVSPEARAAEATARANDVKAAVRASKPAVSDMEFNIQDETTRIVQVVRPKTNKTSLIIGLLVVIIASAAGGFLASRFVPERAAPAESP